MYIYIHAEMFRDTLETRYAIVEWGNIGHGYWQGGLAVASVQL